MCGLLSTGLDQAVDSDSSRFGTGVETGGAGGATGAFIAGRVVALHVDDVGANFDDAHGAGCDTQTTAFTLVGIYHEFPSIGLIHTKSPFQLE